ncbi:MAG: MBL fold metallo-hydrolase [Oscillospiraceae bacterium]|nr:MBL fold metallo-hydrolase [Oscillospiraceae bacterium]
MHRYVNCIAHSSSEGNLLIGDGFTAIIDCGMVFCAEKTIQSVKTALQDRPLDYIFFSHTHYDHIGALPFFRREWPDTKIATSQAGAAVLLKDTPRRIFRELSAVAAKTHGIECDMSYDDNEFQADIILKEGDAIGLGGLSVQVLETPGHTRDSLSFFVPELELLIVNETLGVLMPDGTVYPCYLTSYDDTIRSIEKCRGIPHRHLSLPHRGVVRDECTDGFFDKSFEANTSCHKFITCMSEKGLNESEMLELFYQKYGTEILLEFQPREAFFANARATIASTLKG